MHLTLIKAHEDEQKKEVRKSMRTEVAGLRDCGRDVRRSEHRDNETESSRQRWRTTVRCLGDPLHYSGLTSDRLNNGVIRSEDNP
jgi:hypothetical protein